MYKTVPCNNTVNWFSTEKVMKVFSKILCFSEEERLSFLTTSWFSKFSSGPWSLALSCFNWKFRKHPFDWCFYQNKSLWLSSWCFFVLSCKQWSTIEIWFSSDSTKTVGLHCNLRSILIGQRIQEQSRLGEKDRCWRLNPEWIISRLTQSQLTTTTIYIRHCQFSLSDQH